MLGKESGGQCKISEIRTNVLVKSTRPIQAELDGRFSQISVGSLYMSCYQKVNYKFLCFRQAKATETEFKHN